MFALAPTASFPVKMPFILRLVLRLKFTRLVFSHFLCEKRMLEVIFLVFMSQSES
jgi:hypothetical protein